MILLSTAAITLYAVSITISELDAYALQSMERNAQYVSREISALLRNTQMQSVLFASDKTVDEALAGYDAKTTLQKWESWKRLGVKASEMESAALFVVAAALGVRCGSCFHAVWNQEREKAGLAMPMTEDTTGAVKVGIDAMKRIIAADLESGK